MSKAWSADVLVPAVRQSLRNGGVSAPGFHLDDVWAEHGDIVVAFRWRKIPNRYGVRLPMPPESTENTESTEYTEPWENTESREYTGHQQDRGTGPESPWTGIPVDSEEEWARDVARLLEEELATGAVFWAHRQRRGDLVELDWRTRRISPPNDYFTSAVVLANQLRRRFWILRFSIPVADFGRSLAKRGLDVRKPRSQYRRGRLLSWLKLATDDDAVQPVGHVSVAWHPKLANTATLDVLQLVPGVPESAAAYLAQVALHNAAESGARVVQAACEHPQLAEIGFHRNCPEEPATVDLTALD